jgi:restriction endonuclease Mrr
MLPSLELASDGKEHKLSDAIEHPATTQFHLTEAERKELLPSGKQARFANRVGWACTAWCASMVGEPDRSASAISKKLDYLPIPLIELLVKMGYGGSLVDAGMAICKTGDEGIDGIIKEDRLGLDAIYIQAKRWNNTVGRPEIQQFVGALAGKGARKGIFITTARFSEQAKSYLPANVKVVLIDGEQLSNYAIEVNLGVSVVSEYQIKRLDLDCFDGE